MKWVMAVDVGEDNPALIGPFVSEAGTRAVADGITERWGHEIEVMPLYGSMGEYIRISEGG